MISVLSTTNKYILQPSLLDMHQQSREWLSATEFWKKEIDFFQKLLTSKSAFFTEIEDKQKIGHFQSLIMYYNVEVIDKLARKLRTHENALADMLQSLNESDTQYFHEHKGLMEELSTFARSFNTLKQELFEFIEKALR
ncbi:hypothetical protein SanaruYs_32440 [Chryseotalea sanaruensis]|uniref:Uncharacterized protein n=1 Tax=Chryseotalea sanaruensis TaxID=2482724 RepID=A0A401UDQ5_9BACT|nr:hypothetical protein [Chryseotalea sanaruensis]GCC53003.1 hypothetical protein SanaruYs_32440 [Chryseotalea sanaruensis]